MNPPSLPYVLLTPLGITRAVAERYPDSKAEEVLEPPYKPRLKLTVSTDLPPIEFDHAVQSQEFFDQLGNYKRQRVLRPQEPASLDYSRFKIAQSLSDWEGFRRALYESNGKKCEALIADYLHQGTGLETLTNLGLAPSQLRNGTTPATLAYFKALFEGLDKLDEAQRSIRFSRLQHHYPTVLPVLLNEAASRQYEAGVQKASSDFEEITKKLKQRVQGQDGAVLKVTSELISQKKQDDTAVFLFVGPTGVGKTELAKAISTTKQSKFVFLPMAQYANEMDITKFFGSGAGYVGSTDKPHLAKELDKCKPIRVASESSTEVFEVRDSVILFDEFEKCHPRLKQSLLTILDEKYYIASYTESYSNVSIKYVFKKCCIVLTSNLYSMQILEAFSHHQGLNYGAQDSQRLIQMMGTIAESFKRLNNTQPVVNSFSPELLGRMRIVPFGPIPRGECYQGLLKSKLSQFIDTLKTELGCREIVIEEEQALLRALEQKLYRQGIDLRAINIYFEESIKGLIYRQSHKWGVLDDKKFIITIHDNRAALKLAIFLNVVKCYHPVSEVTFLD